MQRNDDPTTTAPGTRDRWTDASGFLSTLRPSSLTAMDVVLPGAAFVVVVLAWELALPAVGVEPYIMPTPSAIVEAFVAERATIFAQLEVTLVEFAIAFTATAVVGYLLALAMAYSKTLERVAFPYVIVVRSIPVVTLLPVFIIWFGFGFNSVLVIAFLISFFPMVVNTLSGFQSTDDELVEMLESFSANRRELYRHVYLYSSLPSVFAALKICTILAFTGAIVGEFLVGRTGIGALILTYNTSFETAAMFASILTLSVTELLVFGAIHKLENLVVVWQ